MSKGIAVCSNLLKQAVKRFSISKTLLNRFGVLDDIEGNAELS